MARTFATAANITRSRNDATKFLRAFLKKPLRRYLLATTSRCADEACEFGAHFGVNEVCVADKEVRFAVNKVRRAVNKVRFAVNELDTTQGGS
jgi:hypothetical protein